MLTIFLEVRIWALGNIISEIASGDDSIRGLDFPFSIIDTICNVFNSSTFDIRRETAVAMYNLLTIGDYEISSQVFRTWDGGNTLRGILEFCRVPDQDCVSLGVRIIQEMGASTG